MADVQRLVARFALAHGLDGTAHDELRTMVLDMLSAAEQRAARAEAMAERYAQAAIDDREVLEQAKDTIRKEWDRAARWEARTRELEALARSLGADVLPSFDTTPHT